MEKEQITSPYSDKIHTIRLVVLLEEKPFNNKYYQISFTHEQFMAISKVLFDMMPIVPQTGKRIMIVPRPLIELPEDMEQFL